MLGSWKAIQNHRKHKARKLIRNLNHLERDRGYRFSDIDPVLTEVRNMITDSGESLTKISNATGVSLSCLKNWMDGTTKRPQNLTIDFVTKHFGYKRNFNRIN